MLLLADKGFQISLLQVLALLSRRAPLDVSQAVNQHSQGVDDSIFADLWCSVGSVAGALLRGSTVGGPPDTTPRDAVLFALSLLRMGTLQCCASRHAAVVKVPISVASGGRVAPTPRLFLRPHPGTVSLIAHQSAALELQVAVGILFGLALVTKPAIAGHADLPYKRELVEALADSGIVEHSSRLLLQLQATSAFWNNPAGMGADAAEQAAVAAELARWPGLLPGFQSMAAEQLNVTMTFVKTLEMLSEVQGSLNQPQLAPEDHDTASTLSAAIWGRNTQHLVMSMAVSTLCVADGGPSYGLPSALLTRLPLLQLRKKGDTAGGHKDVRSLRGRQEVDADVLFLTVDALILSTAGPPPGPRAARSLLTRIGKMAVSSAAAPPPPPGAVGSSAGTSAGGSGSGGGGAHGSRPGLQLVLGAHRVWPVLLASIGAMAVLSDARPPAGRREPVAALWQLARDLASRALHSADDESLEQLAPYMRLERFSASLGEGPLPAQPKPELAGALEGGLAPTLECLLRCAAREPGGPHARLLARLFPRARGAWASISSTIAFGPPLQATALIITIGKFLRCTAPQLLFAALPGAADGACAAAASAQMRGRGLDGIGAVCRSAVALLETVLGAVCDVLMDGMSWLVKTFPGPVTASVLGGLPEPAQRVRLQLSLALRLWLPPLAALVRQLERSAASQPLGHAETDPRTRSAHYGIQPLAAMMLPLLQLQAADGGDGSSAAATAPAARSWRQIMLGPEVGAVELLGAMLRIAAQLALRRYWADHAPKGPLGIALNCCGIASLCPREVWLDPPAAGSGSSGAGAGAPAAPNPAPAFGAACWPQEVLRDTAVGLRGVGLTTEADAVKQLVTQLRQWGAGGAMPAGLGGAGLHGPRAVQGSGGGGGFGRSPPPPVLRCPIIHWADALAAPSEVAAKAMGGCCNVMCANMSGDSEAELQMFKCSRCSAVRYCSRDCQAADWRAGHKGECVRRPG